jgi:hypothetical protein
VLIPIIHVGNHNNFHSRVQRAYGMKQLLESSMCQVTIPKNQAHGFARHDLLAVINARRTSIIDTVRCEWSEPLF